MSQFDRDNFYPFLNIKGNMEADIVFNRINVVHYEKSRATTYEVKQEDVLRPDTISTKVYGDPGMYWVLMLANDIVDPLEEIYVGQVLTVPNREDIYNYYQNNKVVK